MYFEMSCSCSASINLDLGKDKEDAAWLLANRFVNAHAVCGFVSPLNEELPMSTKKYDIKIKKDKES